MSCPWYRLVVVGILLCLPSLCRGEDKPAAPEAARRAGPSPVWTITEGCDAPESAYYDAKAGLLYVSQISGKGDKKDQQGWISRYDIQGKTLEAKWVTGLNAPKGIHSFAGTIWVSDIDEIVAIDAKTAKITLKIAVQGAKFLNDVACSNDGTVYVSDLLASKIYQVKDGKLSVFAEGDELECPDGLLVHDDQLIVAGWGLADSDFSTKVSGRVFSIDIASKKKTLITPEPVGNLEGLDFDGSGGYLVSDWMTGRVLQITVDGDVRTIVQMKKGIADLCFVPAKELLIIPCMLENKVEAYLLPDLTE